MNPTRDLVVVLALLGASAIVPLMGGDYWIGVGISTFMWVALTQSWSLLSGLSGYVSLGHVVFYGLGTYIVVTSWEVVPIAVALALAAGAAAVFAFVTGMPVLRVRGPYFVILTFGIAELV